MFSGDVMSYSIIDCFMISFCCGMVFGLVYEMFRMIRRLLPLVTVTIICDIAFFAAAALLVYNLSLALGNYIRIYTLLGFGAGVFTYIQTIGRLIYIIESAVLTLLKKTIGAFIAAIINKIAGAFGVFAHKTAGVFRTIHDFYNKRAENAKKHLQFQADKMYNSKRHTDLYIKHRETNNGENIGGKYVIQAKIRRSG